MIRRASLWSDPRVKPPFKAAEVDWQHPLARHLVGCWLFNAPYNIPFDMVQQTPGTIGFGTPLWTSAGGQMSGIDVEAPECLHVAHAVLSPAFPWKVVPPAATFLYGVTLDITNEVQILSSKAGGADGPFIWISATGFVTTRFVELGSDTTATTALVAGRYAVVGGVYTGVNQQPVMKGIREGTPTAITFVTETGVYHIGSRSDHAANRSMDGRLHWHFVWNRLLPDVELLQMTIEPFAFFRPIIRRRWFVPAAAVAAAGGFRSRIAGGLVVGG